MKYYHFILALFALAIISCGSDDPSDNFENEFSFTIDGTDYNYSDFEISHDTLSTNRVRIFVKKIDGDLTFTQNVYLDLGVGTHPMSFDSGVSFYADLPVAAFFCLDETLCSMTITKDDKEARQFEANFTATGESLAVTQTIAITNGVIRVSY